MHLHVPKEHTVTSLMMGILWIAEAMILSARPRIKDKASLQDPIVSNNVVKNNSAWSLML